MANIFGKKSSIKLPQRDREAQHEEYGREGKGAVLCPDCGNVHFRKKWHASLATLHEHAKDEMLAVSGEKRCHACTMVREHTFEGELFLEKVPERFREELMNLIRHFGEHARANDPQDRIIAVEDTDTGYRITTTENQLADRLAKKIKDAFNTADIHFTHSKEPFEVDRIRVIFRSE
ncbi:MAG: hypothetical protein COW88_00745 [Candidatus Lloydbacteria bacterium CG22_combo_CG10-13_8_21_14_all_47_15]|uniref:Nmd3 N-terminal domain-containing protein n=1 Tax=Candidatus Lloydbacteria bacterium CG22_combo_CG10-13_8_21_14_all_47_15 TaxID=1974635 RepID=A0A2H0CVA5_9BACT|nr:MAG: hypothetical protein COW88_00745 [Candidatus Lloydbacteria bacterium CG22_combo_CG10-13_8_21_14_all_47_15]